MKCLARQTSDQMTCHACGLVWDMNDSDPPQCRQGVRAEAFALDGKSGVQDAPLEFHNTVTGRFKYSDAPYQSENLPRQRAQTYEMPVVGYMDPEAAFMLALKNGCVLSSHVDLLLVRDPRGKYTMPLFTVPDQYALRNERQSSVHNWCVAAFGDDHAKSVKQRAVRLVEEAVEAAQAAGVNKQMLHNLVAHVYDKPVGDLAQEIGGVGVTLVALAAAAGVSADECEHREFNRVLSKPLQYFAARNEMKNAAGFDVTKET